MPPRLQDVALQDGATFLRSVSRAADPARLVTASETEIRAMREYREHVQRTAGAQRRALVNNSSPAHFVVVMEQLLRIAKHRVQIFSNHLTRYSRVGYGMFGSIGLGQPVWSSPEVIAAARTFLSGENTGLDIIVRGALDADRGDLSTHPFLRDVIEDDGRKGVVTLRIVGDQPNLGLNLFKQNFVVVDGKAYRHELNGDSIRAVVQFGDDGSAKLFEDEFRRMTLGIDRLADPSQPRPQTVFQFYRAMHQDRAAAHATELDGRHCAPSSQDKTAAALRNSEFALLEDTSSTELRTA